MKWKLFLIVSFLILKAQSTQIQNTRSEPAYRYAYAVPIELIPSFYKSDELRAKCGVFTLSKIKMIADQFEFTMDDLARVLYSESRFNYKVKNAHSSASGIWQFTKIAIRAVNDHHHTHYVHQELLNSPPHEQLDVLYLYLKMCEDRYEYKIRNKYDLKVAFMVPAYGKKSDSFIVPFYKNHEFMDKNNDQRLSMREIRHAV